MAAKFFTGLPLDGPDPECVKGNAEAALAAVDAAAAPRPGADHSHVNAPVPVTLRTQRPGRACDEDPLSGLPPLRGEPVARGAH
jgi:hypothetical protein